MKSKRNSSSYMTSANVIDLKNVLFLGCLVAWVFSAIAVWEVDVRYWAKDLAKHLIDDFLGNFSFLQNFSIYSAVFLVICFIQALNEHNQKQEESEGRSRRRRRRRRPTTLAGKSWETIKKTIDTLFGWWDNLEDGLNAVLMIGFGLFSACMIASNFFDKVLWNENVDDKEESVLKTTALHAAGFLALAVLPISLAKKKMKELFQKASSSSP